MQLDRKSGGSYRHGDLASAGILERHSRPAHPTPYALQLRRIGTKFPKEYDRNAELFSDDRATPRSMRVLLSGWACHQHIMRDGRRQIFCFLLPGDLLAAPFRSIAATHGETIALTKITVADVAESEQPTISAKETLLAHIAEHETQLLIHSHILRLGCMDALERTANLIVELETRLIRSGHRQGQEFPFPPTQDALGDALGMSSVHVSRTLSQLKRASLIAYSNGRMTVLDRRALSKRGEL